MDGERIFDARCPSCSWWVRVVRVLVNTFTSQIVSVTGECKRHGIVIVRDYEVWP